VYNLISRREFKDDASIRDMEFHRSRCSDVTNGINTDGTFWEDRGTERKTRKDFDIQELEHLFTVIARCKLLS
jgi:hypothetical protein